MGYEAITYEKRDRIAYVTLNRPQSMNAINTDMAWELPRMWEDFKRDSSVWVAIFTGAGERAFCAGADVKEVAETGSIHVVGDIASARTAMRLTALQNGVWKPVITAVNGVCAGGGLHFVVDHDIVICSENATFLDPHVSVGQVAAFEPIGLSRRIPLEAVLRMALLGAQERIDAQRAYQLGMVSQVVAQEKLMETAQQTAEKLLMNSPATMMATKRAIWEGLDRGYLDAVEHGWQILVSHWQHGDCKEGPRAFAEKRRPNWLSP